MYRDTELPRGFNDADFEMRNLEHHAWLAAQAKKQGKCDHGWRQVGGSNNNVPVGFAKCLYCHVTLTVDEMDREYNEIHD